MTQAPTSAHRANLEPQPLDALADLTRQIRHTLVQVSQQTKTPHLASCLSGVDLLTVLYGRHLHWSPALANDPQRDKFLLSKGHAASLLYTVLAYFGMFEVAQLFEHGQTGSAFEEHPGIHAPAGVETVSGSLGHNLGIAVGMAKAAQLKQQPNRYFVLMGDGEMNEGSVWEAAMLAPALGLNNLVALVDVNGWQGTGRSKEISALEPLDDKWRSFGWDVQRIDGHDLHAIDTALAKTATADRPQAIIADTVKGKGVSFMEDDNNWHYRMPTVEEVAKAAKELGIDSDLLHSEKESN